MEQSNDSLRVNHNDGEESKTSAQVFEGFFLWTK
ncbi:CARF isoform 19 [Pan troglodytes]|uniref:Calcium responsive transcription factor n=2 Tax=Homininae TaxID=207598 RepID=F8WDH0_HUMAN|nr:CARF isoform 19 [Pan troglodytes]